MRRAFLQRNVDVSGVSGTGRVLEIVELQDGRICGTWLSETSSCIVHNNIDCAIYIHSHKGASNFEFDGKCGDFPKLYQLIHEENRSGLSGVGKVAEVAEFSNGKCVLNWVLTPYQIEFFLNIDDLLKVHCSNDYSRLELDF